jgi:hypothetical protein
LAVNDQLKLASDNLRTAGQPIIGPLRISWYDPPELSETGASTAGDVWGFGMTLLQALTLGTPTWPDQRSETATLPSNLPTPFVGLVRRCLSRTPANRPTVTELEAPFKTALRANSGLDVQPPAPPAAKKVTPPPSPRKRYKSLLTVAAVLVLGLVGWLRYSATPQTDLQSSVLPPPAPVAAAIIETAPEPALEPVVLADESVTAPPVAPAAVVYEAKPNVPTDLSDRIKGAIDVTLRVMVDPAGDVMATLMENPGRNKSLATLADAAARDWKFVQTDQPDPRVWLLRFEFTHDGVITTATEQ